MTESCVLYIEGLGLLFNIDKDLRLNPGHTCSGNVVTLNEYKYYNHIFLNSI